MPDNYESGGSKLEVAPAAQSLAQLTVEDLMALPPKAARPSWMLTRFPVSMDEYRRLNEAAKEPDRETLAATEDSSVADADLQAEYEYDPPEGEGLAAEAKVLAPAMKATFEGIPQTAFMPPDCTCAVGADAVMLAVNTDLAVYNKNGVLRFRWANMTALFRNVLPSGASLFDPRVAYDHYAQRWIVVSGARRESPPGSWLMVGVSQGTDPGGAYWVWALDATLDGGNPSNNWADYPMLGFDTQAIYISSNMFAFNGGYQYAKLRILNKAQLYSGSSIQWFDFWNLKDPSGAVAFTVQPAVHFRGTGGNPPAYLINALWPSGNTLTFWTLSNPLGFWSGGTASLASSSVSCRNYDLPPDAEQPGTSTRIETNDTRLLNAIFQNVGGVQRLWTCHTSKITWSGETVARSAVQWYEIDTNTKAVIQQNGYGASGKYYYFPAIQTDLRRNAYLVFSRSNATEYASLRQTGRLVTDPANDLQSSSLIKAGEGSYNGGRWGDYFGICRDGNDANQVWVYGEYADTGNTWGTWVGALKF
jgi:hypothetical protein